LNKDKDLVVIKAQLFKQHAKNKHIVVKGIEVERAIKRGMKACAKALQFWMYLAILKVRCTNVILLSN